MSITQPIPVNTATAKQSIWRDVNQGAFRKRVDDLKRKTKTPGEASVHTYQAKPEGKASSNTKIRVLPFNVEERVANDIAFLAAAQKDVVAVSAVALEESIDSHRLTLRLAANGPIQPSVADGLRSLLELLQACAAKRLHREGCRDQLFDKIVRLNRGRIHSRLQSAHAGPLKTYGNQTPQREPLYQELQGLAQHAQSKKNSAALKQNLAALALLYQSVDECTENTSEELNLLKDVTKQSCDFCTPNGRTIEETIAFYGFRGSKTLENKHIRQINKLGRYWSLCEDLTLASRKYGTLFKSLSLELSRGYEHVNAPILGQNARIPCFVHAEIQLLIHYTLYASPGTLSPRVFGVSKSACYLCDLFIHNHKRFFVTKTHGKLYPLWTVPDLAQYNNVQRLQIRQVLAAMNREIKKALSKRYSGGQLPTESFVHLRSEFLSSPVMSDQRTVSSTSSITLRPNAQSPAEEFTRPEPPVCKARSSADSIRGSALGDPTKPPSISTPPGHITSKPADERFRETKSASSYSPPHASLPPHIDVKEGSVADKEDLVAASSSVSSWELPVQRDISVHSPWRAKINDIHMTFEIESPSQGNVMIAQGEEIKGPNPEVVFDADTMEEGEMILLERNDEEEDFVFHFRGPETECTQITLRWLKAIE